MRALLAQLAPRPRDLAANVERAASVVAEADADLVVLPELFLSGYRLHDLDEVALTVRDPRVGALRDAARRAGRALVVGAVERLPGGFANSALCVERDGSIAGVHRKTHLFGNERRAFQAGDRLEPIALAGRCVGPQICFEIEFPEVARTLRRRGADLLVTVSANMDPYRSDHDLFSRVRALENNVPHLYVNRVGEESGLRFTGESRLVGATGELLAEAGPGERLVACDVPAPRPRTADTDYLAQLRPAAYGS